MRGMRGTVLGLAATLAATGLGACGGGERQDAGEAEREYRMEIVEASFPREQRLAQSENMRISVRNADDVAIPTVAVTVATDPGEGGGAPLAFGAKIPDPEVADAGRPIWIVDEPPRGGETAVTNTWSLGSLRPGQTKQFTWKVTPVQAGDYTLQYSAAPSLTGKATAARGRTDGRFRVSVSDVPPDARVGDDGEVIESPGTPAD